MPTDTPYLLTEGPLPKSTYTYQLESITRALMMGADFTFTKENHQDFIHINDDKYNWTDIINTANLDHIDLDRHDFKLYQKHLESSFLKSGLMKEHEQYYLNALHEDYFINSRTLPEPLISFQEMQAINFYTTEFYKKMNQLMRGTLDLSASQKPDIKEAIIQSVMCASGLRKIPEVTIHEAYRGGKQLSQEEEEEYIHAANEHGVIELTGFVSSSVRQDKSYSTKPVEFHFTHLKGIYVAPISNTPEEDEFLIPPTQVQVTGYQFNGDRYFIEGRIVSDLAKVKPEGLLLSPPPEAMKAIPFNDYPITSCDQLADALIDRSPEECWNLCESEIELITSAEEFAYVLEFLSHEQRNIVYQTMMTDNRLLEMIGSHIDLAQAIKYISPEEQQVFLDALKDTIAEMIGSASELGELLGCIPSALHMSVLTAIKDKLPNIIRSVNNISEVILCVPPGECIYIFDMIDCQSPKIIQSISDLTRLCQDLSHQQCFIFFDQYKERLPSITQSTSTFHSLRRMITAEQYEHCNSMKRLMDQLRVAGVSDQHIKKFTSSLMSENNLKIKTQFNRILEEANEPADLCSVLSTIEKHWLKQINNAVELNLTDAQLESPSDISASMNQYVIQTADDDLSAGQSELERIKALTHQYKHAIQPVEESLTHVPSASKKQV